MFFILSKIIGFFLNPLSLIWSMVIILLIFRKKNWSKKIRWIPVVAFLLFSNSLITLEYARLWEYKGKKISYLTQKYDVGVVLTGMADYNADLERLALRRGADRIWWAMQLYKKGKIDKILISGKTGHLVNNGLDEANQFKSNLMTLGIPADDIIAETESLNTYENAKYSAEIIDTAGFDQILLITSGMHMKRSIACFQNQGVETVPFSTDHFTGKHRYYKWSQIFLPNMQAFSLWDRILHEQFGYLTYAIMGYL